MYLWCLKVVINSGFFKNLKYNEATPVFHQWRDQVDTRTVYGIKFNSEDDAYTFGQSMRGALDALNNGQSNKTSVHIAAVNTLLSSVASM